jgi:exonuclease III
MPLLWQVLEVRVRQLLESGREVLVVGDLNISPQPLDNCNPSEAFSSRPDRVWLNSLLQVFLLSCCFPGPVCCDGACVAQAGDSPLVDVFRRFHPNR